MFAKYLLVSLQTGINPACCLQIFLKGQINLICPSAIRWVWNWLRCYLNIHCNVGKWDLGDEFFLIFYVTALYKTFINNPLTPALLPVWMNVVNHSQNFRKADLSGACVSDSVRLWKLVFKQAPLLSCSVSPLPASAEFVHRCAESVQVDWWVPADTTHSLVSHGTGLLVDCTDLPFNPGLHLEL